MQNITIIVYIACALVWILSILRCLLFRQLASLVEKARRAPSPEGELPPLSVIITSHDQCDFLRRNLPLILNQIYPNFEVLVVDMNSTDDTKKLLEKMEEEYPNLRHTFTPATSRDISVQRLAITLGVKASTHSWLVITQADCTPISHQWLRRLGESIKSHRSSEIAVGYTRYMSKTGYTEKRMDFYKTWQSMKNLVNAEKHGAYRSEGTNLAYKKELFLSHQGFASHANLLVGATDIMVNQHSNANNTAVCLHPEATVEQQMPSKKHWVQDRLYFQETKQHFTKRWYYQIRSVIGIIIHALLVTMILTTLALSVWQGQYVVTGVTVLLAITHLFIEGLSFNVLSKTLNNQTQNMFITAWFLHLLPFWNLRIWMQHSFGNKQKFRKKYI